MNKYWTPVSFQFRNGQFFRRARLHKGLRPLRSGTGRRTQRTSQSESRGERRPPEKGPFMDENKLRMEEDMDSQFVFGLVLVAFAFWLCFKFRKNKNK